MAFTAFWRKSPDPCIVVTKVALANFAFWRRSPDLCIVVTNVALANFFSLTRGLNLTKFKTK